MAIRQPIGSIDHTVDHYVMGWFSQGRYASDQFNLIVDADIYGPCVANNYRADLHAIDPLLSNSGFLIPVPIKYWDGAEHAISISYKDKIIYRKLLTLKESRTKLALGKAIFRERQNKPIVGEKRIAIYSTFTAGRALKSYHLATIDWLRRNGYYVILIAPVDSISDVESMVDLCASADHVIIRSNAGYDFGSWATAIIKFREQISTAEYCFFMNDSIIGPFSGVNNLIQEFERSNSDFWGVADSYDRQYHCQSFMFGIKGKLLSSPYLDAYFVNDFDIDAKKPTIIEKYELKMLDYFKSSGFHVDIYLPYEMLVRLFRKNTSSFLAEVKAVTSGLTLYISGANLITDQGLHYLRNVFDLIESGQPLNPTHFFWLEMLEAGFPFVKKELLISNPTNNKLISIGLDRMGLSGHPLISNVCKSMAETRFYA